MNKVVKLTLNEETFLGLLPLHLQAKSKRFFSDEAVAIDAAKWLSGEDRRKVLDIGAGVGKFCLYGACYTNSEFTGIEIRTELVKIAEDIFKAFDVRTAKIIHGNITDFNISNYTAFYHYNPFQENIVTHLKLDNNILLASDFYHIYTRYTYSQLAMAKQGSRLATYYGDCFTAPPVYKLIKELHGGKLKFWIKE
jgi:16S rRNA A1518/A1519 N6-dimethyltransferase RsmA/KsgA/DIM1 with predicted DNA glycosylase/AP lyase activity